jgi:hypothetical protein
MATPAVNMAGHICRPQRMQTATAIPLLSNGSVGCAPTLGSIKPMAPAAKTAMNVINNRSIGADSGFIG